MIPRWVSDGLRWIRSKNSCEMVRVMPWTYSTAAPLIFMAGEGLDGWSVVHMGLVCIVVGIIKRNIHGNQYKYPPV